MRLIESSGAFLEPIEPGISRVRGFFPDSVVALQTDRHGGLSNGPFASFNLGDHVGDDSKAVVANRARLMQVCSRLGARPQDNLWLNQVHGTRVLSAESVSDCGHQADARISEAAGEVCLVMTADCLPLLIARPKTGQIAAVHAGWRGLCAGVIEATLDMMQRTCRADNPSPSRQFAANAPDEDDWLIWIGPAIGPDSFEVGEDVRQAFMLQDPTAATGFHPNPGRSSTWLADLGLLARQRIENWPGNFVARIAQEGDCVMKNAAQYFSYRRCNKTGGPTGRMASLIFRSGI